jgi:hypothetical protein
MIHAYYEDANAYNKPTHFGELGRWDAGIRPSHRRTARYPFRRVQNHAIALQQSGTTELGRSR